MVKTNKLLPDTQSFLWSVSAPERLSPDAIVLLEDKTTIKYLSAVCVWEIVIKYSIGKPTLPEAPDKFIPYRRRKANFRKLAITESHVLQVAFLPFHHKDPFDRLLIAQAIIEDVPILTAAPIFQSYGVKIIDAEKYKANGQTN